MEIQPQPQSNGMNRLTPRAPSANSSPRSRKTVDALLLGERFLRDVSKVAVVTYDMSVTDVTSSIIDHVVLIVRSAVFLATIWYTVWIRAIGFVLRKVSVLCASLVWVTQRCAQKAFDYIDTKRFMRGPDKSLIAFTKVVISNRVLALASTVKVQPSAALKLANDESESGLWIIDVGIFSRLKDFIITVVGMFENSWTLSTSPNHKIHRFRFAFMWDLTNEAPSVTVLIASFVLCSLVWVKQSILRRGMEPFPLIVNYRSKAKRITIEEISD